MSIPRKEYQNWLEDIEITHKFTNEDGCVCNEIIFTTKNGNKLSLTLFDVKTLSEDTLADEYFTPICIWMHTYPSKILFCKLRGYPTPVVGYPLLPSLYHHLFCQ